MKEVMSNNFYQFPWISPHVFPKEEKYCKNPPFSPNKISQNEPRFCQEGNRQTPGFSLGRRCLDVGGGGGWGSWDNLRLKHVETMSQCLKMEYITQVVAGFF